VATIDLKSHHFLLWVAVAGVMLASIAIIAAITRVPTRYRRHLLVACVFLSGLFYALEFFWPTHMVSTPGSNPHAENFLTPYIPSVISPLANIMSAFLLGLGLFSLAHVHFTNIVRRRPSNYNSIALLVAAAVMLFFGFWSKSTEHAPFWVNATFQHLFNGLYQGMDAAMFSLIAFFILSAAYRAFRIRSVEASILMVSALIVLLGLSFGVLLTMWVPDSGLAANFRMETWSSWILQVISAPALRAIDLGIGLGMLAMALRIWLGIERGALFGE
jgi:hypothetical protein